MASVEAMYSVSADTAVEEVDAGRRHDALVEVRAAAVVPDVVEADVERRHPEDAGPRELGLGDPDAGLRRGHDDRPGVGEPQRRGQVDREPEVGRLQRRGGPIHRLEERLRRLERLGGLERPDQRRLPRRGRRQRLGRRGSPPRSAGPARASRRSPARPRAAAGPHHPRDSPPSAAARKRAVELRKGQARPRRAANPRREPIAPRIVPSYIPLSIPRPTAR